MPVLSNMTMPPRAGSGTRRYGSVANLGNVDYCNGFVRPGHQEKKISDPGGGLATRLGTIRNGAVLPWVRTRVVSSFSHAATELAACVRSCEV